MKSPNAPFLRTFALGFVLVCIASAAHAQWKWKDASGKIQYSDLAPPAGTPDANILQRPAGSQLGVMVLKDGKPVAVAPASTASAPAPKASGPSKAEQEAQAKQKADQARYEAQKRENCASARDNLATLQSGVRMRTGSDGAIMDDQQRTDAMARTQRVIASECN